MSEESPKALPPQYEQKPLRSYCLQYTGGNAGAMVNFAPDFLYQTPDRTLMQKGNPFPVEAGEWVIQWSNTVRRGQFERVPESTFSLTWGIMP